MFPGVIIRASLDSMCEQTYIQATHEHIFRNLVWLIWSPLYEMCIRALTPIDFLFLFSLPCIVCIDLSSLKVLSYAKHLASLKSISPFSTRIESIYHCIIFMQYSTAVWKAEEEGRIATVIQAWSFGAILCRSGQWHRGAYMQKEFGIILIHSTFLYLSNVLENI